MKVWLGFICWCQVCESGRELEKIFDSEEKAMIWVGNAPKHHHPDSEWREYEEHEVE